VLVKDTGGRGKRNYNVAWRRQS